MRLFLLAGALHLRQPAGDLAAAERQIQAADVISSAPLLALKDFHCDDSFSG
jgi:hypothetical protein